MKELEVRAKRDFNNAICLIGIIPFLVFIYLLVVEVGSIEVLTGTIGYVVLVSMLILLLGIVVSRKIMWSMISQLFNYSKRIIELQNKLIEQKKAETIKETTRALTHEINNPLGIIMGLTELMETKLKTVEVPNFVRENISMIGQNCDRISEVTAKLRNISKPVYTTAYGGNKMIDAEKST